MDKEPYNFDQFVNDVKEFLGLLFCCLVGVGLFYYLLRYGVKGDPRSSLQIAIPAGGIWGLIGYFGNLLGVDNKNLLHKPLFQKKKDADHNKHRKT